MPLDATGSFRHNHESAQMHSKAAGKSYGDEKPEESQGDHVEIHPKGDGTFKTVHQGEEMDHPTHGHALIHAAKVHAEEGHTHFHAHMEPTGEHHSHGMKSGEEPESRDHEDAQGMHDHMDDTMGNQDHEDAATESEPQHASAGLGGLY